MLMSMISIQSFKEKKYLPYIIMTIPMVIGGTTWPLGKWLVSSYYGSTIPQLIIIVARYFIAIPIFFLILIINENNIHFQFAKRHIRYLAILGLMNLTIYQIGYMYGETYTTGTDASLLIATIPIAVFTITLLFLQYKFTTEHLIGIMTGFFGVSLVILFETSSSSEVTNPSLGNLLIIMAVIAFAIYTVLLKEFMNILCKTETKISSLAILAWISVFGTVFILPITFLLNPTYLSFQAFIEIPTRIWIGIIYLGIFPTVIGFMLYIEGIKLLDPNKAVVFTNIIPIVRITLSAIFLDEKINVLVHLGSLILIFISIYLVNKK